MSVCVRARPRVRMSEKWRYQTQSNKGTLFTAYEENKGNVDFKHKVKYSFKNTLNSVSSQESFRKGVTA